MKQSYMNMSMNDIIKLIEKKDKRIAELEKKLSEVNENIKIVGRENRKLKKNNERYQERLTEVLYKEKIKNCSTCKTMLNFHLLILAIFVQVLTKRRNMECGRQKNDFSK